MKQPIIFILLSLSICIFNPTWANTAPATSFPIPSTAQIASNMKKVAGGSASLAIYFAVNQLLDGIDWVMDPANNRVIYHKTNQKEYTGQYLYTLHRNYISTQEILDKKKAYPSKKQACTRENVLSIWPHFSEHFTKPKIIDDSHCAVLRDNFGIPIETIENPSYNASKASYLSYEQIAAQIIKDAKAGHQPSIDYLNAIADEIAKQDKPKGGVGKPKPTTPAQDPNQGKDKPKPPPNRKDKNKPPCKSGIVSAYGQCWVCSKRSREPVRQRVEIAKDWTSQLGKCEKGMNSNQLLQRKQWWNELYQARKAENQCWVPLHQPHIDRAIEDKKVADRCNNLLQPKEPKK